MGRSLPIQEPLQSQGKSKRAIRTQFAALCFRKKKGEDQVLLVTSRRSKRWILPKGWPEFDMTPADAAAKEAWEEGGVRGRVYNQCLGVYSYLKQRDGETDKPCLAMVYPLQVKTVKSRYPEKRQRKRSWFALDEAANLVDEPELKSILRSFAPKKLR